LIKDDLRPVRISITEDTAPVKQVEFLINNKIISDLERITARTERLDMISLADHDTVEIRVPFDRNDMLNRSLYRKDIAKADLDSGKVLNVRINANFRDNNKKDNNRWYSNAECNSNMKVSDNRIRNFRSDVYSLNDDPDNAIQTVNIKQQESSVLKSKNISEEDIKKQVMNNLDLKVLEPTSDNVDFKTQRAISDNVDLKTSRATSDNVDLKAQQAIAKDLSVNETMADLSLFKEAINSKAETSSTRKITNTASSEINKHKNESSDPHISTRAAPWWSSSDSFSKVRKIDDDLAKPIAPILNKEKEISNLDQALVIEPLSPKSKEIIPKLQTKNEDSTYNASINNSNNLISYETPKAFDRYPSSFRLKPNRRNSSATPEKIKADLKTEISEYDQTSGIQEDNKNIFKIRQIDSLTSSTLDTTNYKQDEQDVSIEKVSVSPKDVKMTNGQNLSLKDQKQHSLEQIDLIDDESNMKSKIEDIINAIKPIEEIEDNTLIDYGLHVSSKKPITLNSKKEENQNPKIKNRKDLDLGTGKYDQIQENATKQNINAMKMKIENEIEIDKIILADLIKIDEKRKVETKSNILEKKEDLTMKNIAITDKEQNKIDMKNIHNNDAMTLSYPNIRDSAKLITKKDEKSVENIIQDPMQFSKLLSKYDKHDFIYANMAKSLETIPTSKQLEASAKITSEELKQDEQEYLSCINNIPRSSKIEKLNNLSSPKSKNIHHLSEEFFDSKVTEISKKSNVDANKIANKNKSSVAQTKANPTSKNSESKDVASKESINKNVGAIPINNRNNDMIKDTVTVTQSPNIRSPLPKDSEDDHSQNLKSDSNKKNFSPNNANADNSPKNADGSKSFDSTQMRMTSMVTSIFI